MNDESNLYPRSTEYFTPKEPDEQKDERESENNAVLNELVIINRVIKHLSKSIDFYESINAISDDVLTNPDEHMHTVLGNKKAVAILKSQKDQLVALVEGYVKE